MLINKGITLTIVFFVAMFLSAQALAITTPPYFTTSPAPTDYQYCDLYFFGDYEKDPHSSLVLAPSLELDYGILPNISLHISTQVARYFPKPGQSEAGFGDSELGFLWRFIQETEDCPQVGFYPLIEIPTGNPQRNLGNGRSWTQLPIWLEKNWNNWIIDWGGGYAINHATNLGMRNFWFAGVLVQRKVVEPLLLGAELYYQSADILNTSSSTLVNVGAIYDIKPNFSFMFSIGRTIGGTRQFVTGAALYWKLGGP